MIEENGIYKLKSIDFGNGNIKNDDQNDYKVLKLIGDTCYCERQQDKQVFMFHKNHLIDPEAPDDNTTKMSIVMECLDIVAKPTDQGFWNRLKQNILQEDGGACVSACVAGLSSGPSCGNGLVTTGNTSLGPNPTPTLSQITQNSGCMVNGIPVAGKSVKKKKKSKKKTNEEVMILDTPTIIDVFSINELKDVILDDELYPDKKARLCIKKGTMYNIILIYYTDPNVATLTYTYEVQSLDGEQIDIYENLTEQELLDIIGILRDKDICDPNDEFDITWDNLRESVEEITLVSDIDMDKQISFKEKYEEITDLIAKQLDRMNFEFANTEDIIYKKEGAYKYLLKFDNENGILKFKVTKEDSTIFEKEWQLEDGQDITPIFDEIEGVYKQYGI